MFTWRAFAALFAIALFAPHTALAQTSNYQVRLPVALDRLPASLNTLSVSCRFRDAAGVETYGGEAERTFSGGRFNDTLVIDVRRNTRPGNPDPDSYYCTLRIRGRTERGEAVEFRSDGSQARLGWRSVYTGPGGGFYLPMAPGTTNSRSIYGQFVKGEQTTPPPTASGEPCPCGCGDGSACSTATTPAPPPQPATPGAPPPLRLPTPISPSGVRAPASPAPAPLRVGDALPASNVLTTSRFAYTGTGVTVAGP